MAYVRRHLFSEIVGGCLIFQHMLRSAWGSVLLQTFNVTILQKLKCKRLKEKSPLSTQRKVLQCLSSM